MYVMTVTRDGESRKTLASGWTQAEEDRARRFYEVDGYTVTFAYEVWR